MRGIHRRPVNSRHKWPVRRKMFPFDDVIMVVSLFTCQLQWHLKKKKHTSIAAITLQKRRHLKNIHHNFFIQFGKIVNLSLAKLAPVMVFQCIGLFSRILHMWSTYPTWFQQTKYVQCKIWDWNRMLMHIIVKECSLYFSKKQHDKVYCLFYPVIVQKCLTTSSNCRCTDNFL